MARKSKRAKGGVVMAAPMDTPMPPRLHLDGPPAKKFQDFSPGTKVSLDVVGKILSLGIDPENVTIEISGCRVKKGGKGGKRARD